LVHAGIVDMARSRTAPGKRSAPELLYHGTDVEIEGPVRPYTHFGTVRAALQRAAQTVYRNAPRVRGEAGVQPDMEAPVIIYPARVAITSAMPSKDLQGEIKRHSPIQLADLLHYDCRKAITSEERGEVIAAVSRGQDGYSVLSGILQNKGYDGLVYTNDFEDRGSQSWIILDGDQAVLGEQIRMTLGDAIKAMEAGMTEPPNGTEPEASAPAP
jgi:hypothetical protein